MMTKNFIKTSLYNLVLLLKTLAPESTANDYSKNFNGTPHPISLDIFNNNYIYSLPGEVITGWLVFNNEIGYKAMNLVCNNELYDGCSVVVDTVQSQLQMCIRDSY